MLPTFSWAPQLLTLKGRFWMTELSNNSPFCDAFSGPPTSQAGGGIWTIGTGSENPRAGYCKAVPADYRSLLTTQGDFPQVARKITTWTCIYSGPACINVKTNSQKLNFLWITVSWRRTVLPLPLLLLCSPWFGMPWSPQSLYWPPSIEACRPSSAAVQCCVVWCCVVLLWTGQDRSGLCTTLMHTHTLSYHSDHSSNPPVLAQEFSTSISTLWNEGSRCCPVH